MVAAVFCRPALFRVASLFPEIRKTLDLQGFQAETVGFEPTCRDEPTNAFRVRRVTTASLRLRMLMGQTARSLQTAVPYYTRYFFFCVVENRNFFFFLIPSSAEIRIHSRRDPSHQLILVAFVLKPPVLVGIA